MKYLIIISGALFLGIISGLLTYILSSIFFSKKIGAYLKDKKLIIITLNAILAVSNFLAVLLLSIIFKELSFTGIMYSIILYILFMFLNVFSRINKIKNNQSTVRLLMPDPENYNKSNDLKKEYWRLLYEVSGLILGLLI
jgi:hypothetical protein